MVALKTVSRLCLGVSSLIFLMYIVDRFSASARIPIDLYVVPSKTMFGLLVVMSFFVSVTFMIEAKLAN